MRMPVRGRLTRLALAVLACQSLASPVWARPPRTVDQVVHTLGPAAQARLSPYLQHAGVGASPGKLLLLALKEERSLELWARNPPGGWRFVRSFEVTAASGSTGPKLREGDRQVPEGFYRLSVLNPNSSYHLSMKVDYPNALDRERAAAEQRTQLGGDIFIHGKDVSIGCLAVGDPAIEELFTLVARVGRSNVDVWIAPHDLRRRAAPPAKPAWMDDVYATLRRKMLGLSAER
jgi:hypothetical protein